MAASCPPATAPACIPGSSSAVAAGGASRAVSGAAHVPAPPADQARPVPLLPPPAVPAPARARDSFSAHARMTHESRHGADPTR